MSLYLEAASILESPQTSSLKSIIYNPSKPFKSPQSKLYALIVETLKFQDILKEVIENAGILKIERKLTPLLSVLLVHDLLLTKSGIAASNGPLKEAILRHKARLNAEFTRSRIRRGHPDVKTLVDAINVQYGRESEDGVTTSATGLTTFSPRWIRANTLKMSKDEVLRASYFSDFEEVSGTSDMFFYPTVQKLFKSDNLLPDIFAIHPSHNVTTSELYKSGSIILQSASSCLPAIMLNPPKGSTVIDGCAAPGNKTTHLAALVGRTGRVYAVERDKYRSEILEKMTRKAGAEGTVKILKATDFTSIKEGHEAWEADYLLLDPSCSGSGILQRIDWDISKLNLPSGDKTTESSSNGTRKRKRNDAASKTSKRTRPEQDNEEPFIDEENAEGDSTGERLQALSDFQLAIILHAFSFPNAKRITYSTCSIHAEENEHVVVRALNSEVARERGWAIQNRNDNPLKDWYRRGIFAECSALENATDRTKEEVAEGCIRVNRTDSLGGGFFVACFVRNYEPYSKEQIEYEEEGSVVDDDTLRSSQENQEEEEWEGFSGTGMDETMIQDPTPQVDVPPKKPGGRNKKDSKIKGGDHPRANPRFAKGKKGW